MQLLATARAAGPEPVAEVQPGRTAGHVAGFCDLACQQGLPGFAVRRAIRAGRRRDRDQCDRAWRWVRRAAGLDWPPVASVRGQRRRHRPARPAGRPAAAPTWPGGRMRAVVGPAVQRSPRVAQRSGGYDRTAASDPALKPGSLGLAVHGFRYAVGHREVVTETADLPG